MKLRPAPIAALILLSGCGGGGGSSPASPGLVSGQVIVTGLIQPMQYKAEPGRPDVALVVQRQGVIRAVVNDVLQPTPVLDISGVVDTEGEGGCLGLAFDPDFSSNHQFYINYTSGSPMTTRVVRFTMNGDGVTANAGTAHTVFSLNQTPFTNHKGGSLNFGPDGLLYLGLGDGGGGNDTMNRAQDPTLLFGKMLRIDPTGDDFPADTDNNYAIPSGNPYVGTAGVRGEIWDVGVRNPFRWSFDATTGALIIADVGQGGWEEFDYEPAGAGGRNYGWRVREGAHDTGNGGPAFTGPFHDPFLEIQHPGAEAIVGGFIYRGAALPSVMRGRYLFGDYVTNRFWSVTIPLSGGEAQPIPLTAATEHTTAIESGTGAPLGGIVSIDADANGEPIIVELDAGRLIRLSPGH